MWSPNRRLPAVAVAAIVFMAASLVTIFFVAEVDADQGISQKIFYFHVPLALISYICFGVAGWKGLRLLMTGSDRYDLESYTAVHQGTIFGALTLITGSIWAKASWGRWWVWSEDQLVLFLVLFLFYCAYFMLRFSVEPGPRRERISAVYALFGVVLIPVSFLAIRLSQRFIHPVVFTRHGPALTTAQLVAFSVSWAALLLLAYAMYLVELGGKRIDVQLQDLREAVAAR
jgi:heme exporter protein C